MVLAVVTAVILMAGGIRVHADEGKVLADEGKSVRVSTAKQLKAALKNDEVNVIFFKTEAYLSDVTIKSVKGSEKKKLIIDTPNISIINKAMFAEVIIENAKGYTESISGNIITLSDAYIPEGLIVAKNKKVEGLVICDDYFSQPFYMLRKGAQVKSVTLRAYSKEKEIPFNESRYNTKKRQLTIDFVNSYGVELTTVINLDKYGRFSKIQCLGDEIAEFGCNDGKLIFIEERTDKDSTARFIRYYFVPIYEYTVNGHTYHAETREFSRNMGKYNVNMTYEVAYNPNNPKECLIDGKKGILQKESRF